MTGSLTVSTRSATVATRLAAAVVLLAAGFAVASVVLNPDSLRSTGIRFAAIALTGFLAARGIRWARLLLIVLTGLAALYAAVLGVVRPMPLGWRGASASLPSSLRRATKAVRRRAARELPQDHSDAATSRAG